MILIFTFLIITSMYIAQNENIKDGSKLGYFASIGIVLVLSLLFSLL